MFGIQLKTTAQHKKFWEERKIDWRVSYLSSWNHPHRFLISGILKQLNWISLFEIGCGPGANLMNIVNNLPGKQLGGCDVNADAIALAEQTFSGGHFKVGSGEDVMMSDKSVDIVLCDAVLIYVGPLKIKKYLEEIRRITRNNIVFCELHNSSFWGRLKMRLFHGYNSYHWPKLLKKMGFYDINLYKIPKEVWPGTPWEKHGYIIVARVPKRI